MILLHRASNHLNKSLTRLKSNLCWNTIYRVFEREIGQRIEPFFCIHPRSKIVSLSNCNGAMTLLPRNSIHLNRSLTRLKNNLCWNTVESFWAQNLTTYRVLFHTQPRTKNPSLSDCTRTVTLLHRASNHLNKSLTRLKSNLCWNTIYRVFEREIGQRIEPSFCIHPRSKIFSLPDCNGAMTLLPRSSIHLNRSLTRLKSNLCWNTIYRVFECEIWQRIEYFFL